MYNDNISKDIDLSEICQVEKDLTSALRSVVAHGIFSNDVHSKELGDLTDMVKDMAETKKLCWEAKYYEHICHAMEKEEQGMGDNETMGYNTNRYANGRYAPSGHGNMTSSGFTNNKTYPDFKMHQDDWDKTDVMGYSGTSLLDREKKMRGPYGDAYREYEDARRHYTESKSLEDKSHMDQKAMEHVDNSIMTLKEIWANADPTLRKEMKASLSSLVSEMPA